MTTTARQLLDAFEMLSPDEQQEVAVEIMRRTAPAGDPPEETFVELAAELFRGYDAEERARADS